MKIKNIFLLNGKKIIWIIGFWIAAILLHNLVYALFKGFFDKNGGDEAVFFILAIIVIPVYVLISIMYTIIHCTKK